MNDWKIIAETASLYDQAADKIQPHERTDCALPLLIPTLTLQSFACELFLKAVITFEKHEYPEDGTGHDLYILFCRLNGTTQNIIIEVYKQLAYETVFDRKGFMDKLKVCRNLFVDSRYLFQKPQLSHIDFFHLFMVAISAYVTSLYAKSQKSEVTTNETSI